MTTRTILVVDDTIANLDLLVNLLNDYDVIDATNGKDALDIVHNEKVDLILLDIMMPEMDGFEVCRCLKADKESKDIPIIFITAKTDEDSIEKAYELGGSDYVTKPFLPRELLARVKKELYIQDIITELKTLASSDPMTRLYNRRYFNNISQHILGLAQREKQSLSLIMLDIDHFKKINDTYGHKSGDEVIISLANLMLNQQRQSDIICRYGGEEFVMLLPNTPLADATQIAEKLRRKIATQSIKSQTGDTIFFTISAGTASVNLKTEDTIEKALHRADEALYQAKNSGRNRICQAE